MTSRILLVEDAPANIQAVSSILKEQGCQINVATSGQQALDLLVRVRPDLILLDVMMPGMDGFETCRRLFADLVGFTPLSARLPPSELLELLNRVFSGFDELAGRHGL